MRVGTPFSLVSVRVPGASSLDAELFRRRTESAYEAILDAIGAHHLVRVWNFIPGILEPFGGLDHRYMVFNGARHSAYERRFGGTEAFDRFVPTASGVGTSGAALEVHALVSTTPSTPLENPRQIASYFYSTSYGPLPPCFARAAILTSPAFAERRLLVGGTASIRGQDTLHLEDRDAQFEETLDNLAAIVARGLGEPACAIENADRRQELLGRYRQLRVYYVQAEDATWARDEALRSFSGAERVETRQADLCRDGLLVEIEGWATLS